MTIVLKNSAALSVTANHDPDGSITFYTSGPIKLEPAEAVRFAEYITASQPE